MRVSGFPGLVVGLQGLAEVLGQQEFQGILPALLQARMIFHDGGQDGGGLGMIALLGPEAGQDEAVLFLPAALSVEPKIVAQSLIQVVGGIGIFGCLQPQGLVVRRQFQEFLVNGCGCLIITLPGIEQGQLVQGLGIIRIFGQDLLLHRDSFGKMAAGSQQIHQTPAVIHILRVQDVEAPVINDGLRLGGRILCGQIPG